MLRQSIWDLFKNDHPSTPIDEIKNELEEIRYLVQQIINVLHKRLKVKLPIVFVVLEPSILNNDTFDINNLSQTRFHNSKNLIISEIYYNFKIVRNTDILRPTVNAEA